MKLFIVIRWGNEFSESGANGPDTVFLVRAANQATAAVLVEPVLQRMPHSRVVDYPNVCIAIGEDMYNSKYEQILLGPLYEFFHNTDYRDVWVRHYKDEDWAKLSQL